MANYSTTLEWATKLRNYSKQRQLYLEALSALDELCDLLKQLLNENPI